MIDGLAYSQPSNWQTIKLGDAATFINGYAFKPSDWKTEGLEIIRIQNLTKSSNSVNYYDGEINGRYKVKKGDFLISWSATLGIFEWVGDDAWLNQHLFKVVFDKKQFNKSFFKHLIAMSLEEMEKETHGSTMKHITKPRFDNFKIPYPPLAEQQKIAAILDAADSLRQKDQQLVERYTALSQSLFLEMFGDPVTNPMGWEVESFDYFAKIDTKMTTDFSLYSDYPHIGIANIEKDTGRLVNYKLVKDENLESGKYLFTDEHIIYSKIRPNLNKVALPNFSGLASADSYPILVNKDKTNRIFFAYIMRSELFLDFIAKHSSRTNIPKANKEQIKQFCVVAPPLELQNQFAERIQMIEAQKQQAQRSLEKSEALFNSLLQRAFTGELTANKAA